MARKRKKKNFIKPFLNILFLILLLVLIAFLIQKFIIPLWQGKPTVIEESQQETGEIVQEDEQKEGIDITLYFADQNAQYLIPETRHIANTNYPEKQAIIELIKGPLKRDLFPTIPQTTVVNNLYINEDIAYIDLSRQIIDDHPGGSTGELLTVYSIVTTLSHFDHIQKVQMLVEGDNRLTLVGHVDISYPLERDKNWLK